MRKFTPLFMLLFVLPFAALSQYRWDVGGGLGVSNYLGDIGGKENTRRDFVADLKMAKTRVNINGFARMRFYRQKNLFLKTEFNYLMIEGSDRLSSNPGRKYRNLDFRNNIFELSSTLQYAFYENTDMGGSYRYRNTLRVYAFGGLGVFHHDPKGMYNGEWIKLRPLMTEGKKYNPFGICVPVGMGFSYTYKKRHRVSWELNWRTTFTDYLDDISTTYADPSTLSSSTAVAMANKTNIGDANTYSSGFAGNFLPGNKRGDPTHKDSYLTMNVSYSYVIRGSSHTYISNWWKFFNTKKKMVMRISKKF
ncbi:MAG: outer membrane beta-barrel protein [Bacteroidia bacterium]|nr:outer membrane beta-barrel protein [Bacteroidia bacterium]